MNTQFKLIAWLALVMLTSLAAQQDGNAQREYFMRAIVSALSPLPELNSQANVDTALKAMQEAISAGKKVDPEFLKWVEPGLPEAFGKLMQAIEFRSRGLRENSLDTQMKGQKPWLEWGSYWEANSDKVFKKLKVE